MMKKISKQPRKQRLARYVADLHTKSKYLTAHLSKELKEKYGKRSIRIRKGDKVRIMRGNFKGKIGTVSKVNIKKEKIYIEGIENIKRDGTNSAQSFVPSNIIITLADTADKKRKLEIKK